jgi:hypothetical protein
MGFFFSQGLCIGMIIMALASQPTGKGAKRQGKDFDDIFIMKR